MLLLMRIVERVMRDAKQRGALGPAELVGAAVRRFWRRLKFVLLVFCCDYFLLIVRD